MTVTHNSNETIIGRSEINDIEAILSVANTDVNEVEHAVKNNCDSIFTWDYSLARPQLRKLYEKAKTGQWNGSTDLDWKTEVDIEVGGTIKSGSSLASKVVVGHFRSFCMVSRAHLFARQRLLKPCPGTTQSCTPARK